MTDKRTINHRLGLSTAGTPQRGSMAPSTYLRREHNIAEVNPKGHEFFRVYLANGTKYTILDKNLRALQMMPSSVDENPVRKPGESLALIGDLRECPATLYEHDGAGYRRSLVADTATVVPMDGPIEDADLIQRVYGIHTKS